VHNALLEDVSLRLDFKTWALVLDGTWAEGTIAFSTANGPQLSFEARGIEARRGGLLRVGLRDQQWAAVFPFQHVQIDRYGTDPARRPTCSSTWDGPAPGARRCPATPASPTSSPGAGARASRG
jgi:hypothetical protein